MDYLTAKSLQNSLGRGKSVFIRGSEPYQLLEGLESDLEEFTDTACVYFTIGGKS